MFIVYSLLIRDKYGKVLKEYIGKGRCRTARDKGRLDEHYTCMAMAQRATLKTNLVFYGEFVEAIQSGYIVTHVVHRTFEDENAALEFERRAIADHLKTRPDIPLLNRLYESPLSGKLICVKRPTHSTGENKRTCLSRENRLVDLAVGRALKKAEAMGREDLVESIIDSTGGVQHTEVLRQVALAGLEELRLQRLLESEVPEESVKRWKFFEKLDYNVKRFETDGLPDMALRLSRYLASLKKTAILSGTKLSKQNVDRVKILLEHPQWHHLPYTELAKLLNTSWPNVARIMAHCGIRKVNAWHVKLADKMRSVLEDPDRSILSNAALAKKHGISLMSLYRYLKHEKMASSTPENDPGQDA